MTYSSIAGYYLALAAPIAASEASADTYEIKVTNALNQTVKRAVSDTNRLIQEES